MSYEGYVQLLCKNGHYWTVDCYAEVEPETCPNCRCPAIWRNGVNITNGSFDENNKRIDNYKKLKVKKRRVCNHCKSILETIYYIPKRGKK